MEREKGPQVHGHKEKDGDNQCVVSITRGSETTTRGRKIDRSNKTDFVKAQEVEECLYKFALA